MLWWSSQELLCLYTQTFWLFTDALLSPLPYMLWLHTSGHHVLCMLIPNQRFSSRLFPWVCFLLSFFTDSWQNVEFYKYPVLILFSKQFKSWTKVLMSYQHDVVMKSKYAKTNKQKKNPNKCNFWISACKTFYTWSGSTFSAFLFSLDIKKLCLQWNKKTPRPKPTMLSNWHLRSVISARTHRREIF